MTPARREIDEDKGWTWLLAACAGGGGGLDGVRLIEQDRALPATAPLQAGHVAVYRKGRPLYYPAPPDVPEEPAFAAAEDIEFRRQEWRKLSRRWRPRRRLFRARALLRLARHLRWMSIARWRGSMGCAFSDSRPTWLLAAPIEELGRSAELHDETRALGNDLLGGR